MRTITIQPLRVTDVRLSALEAPAGGLLGYASCTLGGAIRIDGIAVRRTADGRLTLSFPARRDSIGRPHAYVRPLSDSARRDFEHQIFSALALEVPA
jgi:DNA-binding cell septation regulator SpoVG